MPSCPHCHRGYTRKTYFDRHVMLCEFLSKSKKTRELELEERSDTPTVRELYLVVMELVVKNKQLEEKIKELSTGVNIQKKKLNATDWLNATYTDADDYSSWFDKLQVTREHLHILFESDYAHGVTSALKQHLNERRPLRAVSTKDNVFYLYNQTEKKWLLMDSETYLKLMYVLDKKIVMEFNNWQRENKEKLYSDEFSLIYNKYTKKVMATRELMYSRVKKELYTHLKETDNTL